MSSDNIPIAYDVSGDGPALILLHGGGQSRMSWQENGVVQQLESRFKVINIDIRGEVGESGKPTDPASYTIERMCQDVLEVADACQADQFILCGYSYGGNIGRFLAATSNRVTKFIMIGINFGAAAEGAFRQYIEEFRHHWPPILQAQREGTLDLATLSAEDREDLEVEDMNVPLAWLTAMLDWGTITPSDLRCPTLWIYGGQNQNCVASQARYAAALENSKVQVKLIPKLTHAQEFSEIDQLLPDILAFAK